MRARVTDRTWRRLRMQENYRRQYFEILLRYRWMWVLWALTVAAFVMFIAPR